MQPREIENLEKLIQTSPLLNVQERQEWLMLLDLMNDKQMGELKRILEPSVSSIKYQVSGEKKQTVQQRPAEIPPLTHIMNLPKTQAVFPHGDRGLSSPLPHPPPPTFAKATAGKQGEGIRQAGGDKSSGFWKKIKDVLKEKELPPGHPEPTQELELPASTRLDTVEPRRTSASLGGPAKGQTSAISKATLGDNIQYPISNIQYQKKDFNLAVPKPVPKSPGIQESAPANTEVQALVQSIIKKRESRPQDIAGDKISDKLFMPGLKDARILMDAKLAKPPLEPHFAAAVPSNSLTLARGGKEVAGSARIDKREDLARLDNLEQVSRLSPLQLKGDLTASLKRLSQTHGYHKLILALEKSPAYLSYLSTGMASLTGKYNLDTGEYKVKTLEKFLAKEEFEKFVDVLREIKLT